MTLKGENWRLVTHGIRASGFDKPFPDIEIRTDPPGTHGSFPRVSEVLDSPVWGKDPVRLEDVWDLLPPNLEYPLTDRDRMPPLCAVANSVGDDEHSLLSVPVCDVPERVIDVGTREALADFLSSYPAVAQHDSYVTTRPGPEAPPDFTRYDHGGGELAVNWRMPQDSATGAERLERLLAMTRGYAHQRYFPPVIAPMKRELHLLMAWWAVLYVLSVLARYEPACWITHTGIDNSRHAVPIERLLERAITHLPVLIANTIAEVSHRPSVNTARSSRPLRPEPLCGGLLWMTTPEPAPGNRPGYTVFVDETEVGGKRPGMGQLHAYGAVAVPTGWLPTLTSWVSQLKAQHGIPAEEELKWSPKLREQPAQHALGTMGRHPLQKAMLEAIYAAWGFSVTVVWDEGRDSREAEEREKMMLAMLFERISMGMQERNAFATVIFDHQFDRIAAEARRLGTQWSNVEEGTQYVSSGAIPVPYLSAASSYQPGLQLADLVVGSTTSAVSGRPAGQELATPLLHLARKSPYDPSRVHQYGLKIHPEEVVETALSRWLVRRPPE